MLFRARRPISGDEGDPDDGRDKDRRELLGQDSAGALGDVCVSWTSCTIRENVVAERRVVLEGRRGGGRIVGVVQDDVGKKSVQRN